jgi:hypothetical protein
MDGAQICIGNCFGRFCIEPEYGRAVGKAANGQCLRWVDSATSIPEPAVVRSVFHADLRP